VSVAEYAGLMGDKSPKAVQKKSAQKQVQVKAGNQKAAANLAAKAAAQVKKKK
jgi:hypothetical protein